MYIDTLKIKNFKIIKDREFKFNKINLLEGSNGFGKSSVFDAIVFLLTNSADAKIEEYINWDADKFSIESDLIDYSGNKLNYFIQLGKTMKRLLKTDNDEFKQSAATQYMSDIINPNIALYSNISVQQKSTQLLFEKPTPRFDKFKLLFGINEVDTAVDKIKDDISELKVKVDKIESEIEILKEKKFEYIEEEEIEDYSALEKEIEVLTSKKEKYELEKKVYDDYIVVLADYKTKIEAKENLEIELNQYSEKLSILKEQYKYVDVNSSDDMKKELNEINFKLNKVKLDISTQEGLLNDIETLKNKISELEISKNNYIIQRIKPFEYSEVYRKELELKEKAFLDEFLEAKFVYEAIKEGKCSQCKAEYSSGNIEESLELFKETKKEHEEILNSIKQINEEEKVYNKKLQENEIVKTKLESIKSSINSYKNGIDSYQKQLEKIEIINIDNFTERKKELEKLIDKINIYYIEYEQLEKEILVIETRLNSYKDLIEPEKVEEPETFDGEFFENKKKELYIFQEKENNLKKIQELNEKTKLEEKNNIKLISEKEYIIDNDRKELRLIETAKKILSKDFTSYLIDWGTEYTKTKMNEIFQKSYGRYNITLNRDSKGVDFYYFSPKNKKMTSVNLASGYEKQLLSVSFRMALASLHKLGIFIFDEIDSDSDETNSLKLYKTILSQKFKQIFCVTHKEPTKDYLRSLPECSTFEF